MLSQTNILFIIKRRRKTVETGSVTEKVTVSKYLSYMFIMMFSLIRQPPEFAEAGVGSKNKLKKV